jgi:ADP-heptose:LPS heptosyltransferase
VSDHSTKVLAETVRRVLRSLGSLSKFFWIIIRETGRIFFALVCGNFRLAGERARVLAISAHNDMVLMISALQRVLRIWPTPKPDIDRILIVKLDRIGDMVTTTPVFDVLRSLFPRARLDIVGHPVPLSLLEGDERIGERIPYRSWLYHALPVLPPGPFAWLLILKLLWRRYPLVVYLRGSFPFLALGLTSRLAATKFVVAEPVIERYLKPLEVLYGPLSHPEPQLHLGSDAARSGRELLEKDNVQGGPQVVIHASASTATKVWPPERFAAVADQLVEHYGARVHFLGSPADQPTLRSIARLSTHSHQFHCNLRLAEVVGVLAAADLFIGNDSGLSHVAAAVKTRLVVLWGPANLSMARPKAPAERCTILYHDVACRRTCPEVRCVNPIELECLMRIQTEDVLAAAGEHLRRRSALPLCLAVSSSSSTERVPHGIL